MISTPTNPYKNVDFPVKWNFEVKVWVAMASIIDSLILSLMGSIYDFSKQCVRIGESVT